MLKKILKSPFISNLLTQLKDDSAIVEFLWSAPKALIIHLIKEYFQKNVLVISSGKQEDNLLLDLQAFDAHVEDFPAWETMPEDQILPSSDIIGKRMEVLDQLTKASPLICMTTLHGALQKVIGKKCLQEKALFWKKNTSVPFNAISALLTSLGYERTSLVIEKGQFALRGGIIDIFPISSPDPYRLEFFGDTLEEIRIFDATTQISKKKMTSISIYPLDELRIINNSPKDTYLFDYLDSNSIIIFDNFPLLEEDYLKLQQIENYSIKYFLPIEKILSSDAPNKLFFAPQKIETLTTTKILEKNPEWEKLSFEPFLFSLSAKRLISSIQKVDTFFAYKDIFSILSKPPHETIVYESKKDLLRHKIAKKNITSSSHVHFQEGYLSSGLVITDIPLSILCDTELTHRKKIRRQKWRSAPSTAPAEFHHLEIGDQVVHFHSGIGKYLGIEKQKTIKGEETEFICLEYLRGAKLYVPLSQAHLISRYIGVDETPPSLDELGKNKWHQKRIRAQKQIIGYAADLLHLYAERSLEKDFSYPSDTEDMHFFEEEFPYIETDDQQKAILSIKNDMTGKRPMERLICGNVGYGKTEVAMRAAFKAAYEGKKQVALLVPTTVLAMQHFETFQKRMASFPVNIGVLSRFNTPKQNKEILEKLARGSIDIIVGTHRLLSKDVSFHNLGLLIIDEEQRFGVRAKEHLKKLKKGIDSLSLSATPIPRTLYLSLVDARDMSIISTPPQDRLPIKTIIATNEDTLIKNAISRELMRDGQVFFIHNRVESIYMRAKHVHALVPTCSIAIVHGQMPSEEVDDIFHQFKQGKIDLLFSTTIIENGIDIPNANTILIDNADTFGLSDLYQLRGRVGRWNRTAYAYFLTAKNKKLADIAKKRLHALIESSGYGGGMKIAMRDLEIRGAGDILGIQQSGQVSSIGFHLYCKLLKKAIHALQKKQPISFTETKIDFSYPASLPSFYISDAHLRMEIYNRLGETESLEAVEKIFEELHDRFGKPPKEVIGLYHLSKIRIFAHKKNVYSLQVTAKKIVIEKRKGKKLEKKNVSIPPNISLEKLEELIIQEL